MNGVIDTLNEEPNEKIAVGSVLALTEYLVDTYSSRLHLVRAVQDASIWISPIMNK